jgi:DNA invertase Pin-like site-specific DNA recombinase
MMDIYENNSCDDSKSIPVAQYLRMSTDNQKYSTHNQEEYIKKYAADNGMIIIKTYQDEGKSGLTVSGRSGLKKLIEDVTNHRVDIEAILIYDVSRFGRFQDPDESVYYDFLLKQSGIPIIYCSEPISKDNPEMSSLYLVIQRHAAASYSRNLSEKVFAGQKNLIKRGYRQGGISGFGLRRQLVDENENKKEILQTGQRKSLQSDRVKLIPGPIEEVNIVNHIFKRFVIDSFTEREIAIELNELSESNDFNFCWTKGRVHQIIINEKYIGNNVFNRTSYKLKKNHIKNPKSEWVRKDSAFYPVVDKEIFYTAQSIISERSIKLSNDDVIVKLKELFKEKGALSGIIIDEDSMCPSSSIYRSRFGGLLQAYKLVGYTPKRDYNYIKINRYIQDFHSDKIDTVKQRISLAGGWIEESGFDGILKVNDEFYLSILISKCKTLPSGNRRWRILFDTHNISDIIITIRMDSDNTYPIDYYIFPSIENLSSNFLMKETNPLLLELYRYEDLESFYAIVARLKLSEVV